MISLCDLCGRLCLRGENSEDKLAAILKVSREKIRAAKLQLVHFGYIRLIEIPYGRYSVKHKIVKVYGGVDRITLRELAPSLLEKRLTEKDRNPIEVAVIELGSGR